MDCNSSRIVHLISCTESRSLLPAYSNIQINIKVAGTEESHSLLPERLRAYAILPDQLLSFDLEDAEEDEDDVTSEDENY